MCYGPTHTGVEPKPRDKPLTPRRNPLRLVPPDDRGYCSACGANFFEYLECRDGDCNWVRETKTSVPQVKAP